VVVAPAGIGGWFVLDSAWFLSGDDDGRTYFPPTLLAEAMAQIGAILVLYPDENRGRTILFRTIEDTTFHRRIPAGSTVRIEGRVQRMRSRLGSLKMVAYLQDELAAEGVMGFALPD
jgi:3-hydroxymyristoyl/3-hydroxydecanoyl-(acyl carrier protein) dehydratase